MVGEGGQAGGAWEEVEGGRGSGRMSLWRWYAPAAFGSCLSSKYNPAQCPVRRMRGVFDSTSRVTSRASCSLPRGEKQGG